MKKISLLQTIYNNNKNLLNQVLEHIANGADLNTVTKYGESALRVASNNGRFEVVKLLIDSGADEQQLGWTPSFYEIVFGTVESLEKFIKEHQDIEERDYWDRTPFLLSIQFGDIEKTSLLLQLGANPKAVGRCSKPAVNYAVINDSIQMLKWLHKKGFDIESVDQFKQTPLHDACELGQVDSVQCLVGLGADINKSNHIPENSIQLASNMEVAQILINQGADLNDVNEDVRAELLGLKTDGKLNISKKEYKLGKNRIFGDGNPQNLNLKFWLEMIKSDSSAWKARDLFSKKNVFKDSPVWCFSRNGRTTTILDDGRIIEIGGEHEDSYDPDFCIYNDVVVFHKDGKIEIYLYPELVFPPTDFHTATLVDGGIYIIGNLGYYDSRKSGVIPVFRLNINSLKIEKIVTTGNKPGWINRHKAKLIDGNKIEISGGKKFISKQRNDVYVDNNDSYQLCLTTNKWTKT